MVTGRCRCDHLRYAHRHYRPGTDCSLCSCDRYRPRRLVVSILFAVLAAVAASLISLSVTSVGAPASPVLPHGPS